MTKLDITFPPPLGRLPWPAFRSLVTVRWGLEIFWNYQWIPSSFSLDDMPVLEGRLYAIIPCWGLFLSQTPPSSGLTPSLYEIPDPKMAMLHTGNSFPKYAGAQFEPGLWQCCFLNLKHPQMDGAIFPVGRGNNCSAHVTSTINF